MAATEFGIAFLLELKAVMLASLPIGTSFASRSASSGRLHLPTSIDLPITTYLLLNHKPEKVEARLNLKSKLQKRLKVFPRKNGDYLFNLVEVSNLIKTYIITFIYLVSQSHPILKSDCLSIHQNLYVFNQKKKTNIK